MLHIQPVKFQLSFNIQTNMLNIDVRHEINQLHLESMDATKTQNRCSVINYTLRNI